MKKRKQKGGKKHYSSPKNEQKKARLLDEYNAKNYFSDIEYIGRLAIPEYRKDWIEMTMYELRDKANIYERNLGELLVKRGIKFIHQAPFVFYGKKIYFADFYLPEYRMIVEVDGMYHSGDKQFTYDKERDENFRSIKIKTLRLANAETKDETRMALRLSQYIKI